MGPRIREKRNRLTLALKKADDAGGYEAGEKTLAYYFLESGDCGKVVVEAHSSLSKGHVCEDVAISGDDTSIQTFRACVSNLAEHKKLKGTYLKGSVSKPFRAVQVSESDLTAAIALRL